MTEVLSRVVWDRSATSFEQAQAALHEHFEAVTRRVIAQAIGETSDEVEEREGQMLDG